MIQFGDWVGDKISIIDEKNRGKTTGKKLLWVQTFLKFEKYSGKKVLKDIFKHGKC